MAIRQKIKIKNKIVGGSIIEETKQEEIITLTNDYVFKRVLGHVGNEKITAGLISSVIKEQIKTIKINENPITEKDMRDDKVGVLDLKAKLNNETICNSKFKENSKISYKVANKRRRI